MSHEYVTYVKYVKYVPVTRLEGVAGPSRLGPVTVRLSRCPSARFSGCCRSRRSSRSKDLEQTRVRQELACFAQTELATEREHLLERFEEVAAMLRDLDLDDVWDEASDQERRVLVEERVERIVPVPGPSRSLDRRRTSLERRPR